jgi:molybdate transport system ATP-binding protein
VLDAVVARHDETFQLTTLVSPAGELQVPRLAAEVGATVGPTSARATSCCRSVSRTRSARLNVLSGKVAQIAESGAHADVRLDCNGAAVMARSTAEVGAAAGAGARQAGVRRDQECILRA